MNLPRDNKSSCEREVTLAPGQSLPRGSSLSRVHVNRLLEKKSVNSNVLSLNLRLFRTKVAIKSIIRDNSFRNYVVNV